MKIILSKKFRKQFKKLRVNEKLRVKNALQSFSEDPFNALLRNHPLHGKEFKGLRSVSAGGDIHLLFEEKNNYLSVVSITLGSHSYLY